MRSRRIFLIAAAAAPLAACGRIVPELEQIIHDDNPPRSSSGCREPEALDSFDSLGGAPLRYEITGTQQSFKADPRFIEKLQLWADDWATLSGFGPLTAVSTYGAHVDKCGSWHAAGRAFDFGVLTHADGTEISCRYDLFGEDPTRLGLYWKLAASLAKHFNYTLTYRYNEQHHNHIHVDNGASGYDPIGFNERSPTHVALVQGVMRSVFGLDTPANASFDAATQDAARSVQQRYGITQRLATTEGWAAFLDAAVTG